MQANLHISTELSFPAEAITETFGILAVRGAGKSNAAAVMAEEMFQAKLPFVVVDPARAWYGLRASRDGTGPGLPIPIFGGRHGDIPLERGAGQLIADLIVDHRLSCVLDLSEFESEKMKKDFLLDFARRLYQRNEEPLHLFLEEADDYIPQKPMRDELPLLRAWENIVRRGRNRGLGMTLITQRSAVLNKNVLTQVQTLIAMRTAGPQDIAAVEAWLRYHQQSREILASLPSLKDGEAWVWSPHVLGKTVRIRFRRRETFDSGATPKVSARTRAPATLADVDLRAIEARMATVIEKAKSEDPRILRQRIAALEQAAKAQPIVERVEVPVIHPHQIDKLEELMMALRTVAEELSQALTHAREQKISPEQGPHPPPRFPTRALPPRSASRGHAPGRAPARDDVPLKAGERRILQTMARRYPTKLTRAQLGTLARFTPSGGTFGTYFGTLKRQGLIREATNGDVEMTEAGLAYLGDEVPPRPQTTAEVLTMWQQALKRGEWRMLEALVKIYPQSLSREELGDRTGYTATGGTFGTYLGMLRRNGLVELHGDQAQASETLFLT
jgi:hypothetical protein